MERKKRRESKIRGLSIDMNMERQEEEQKRGTKCEGMKEKR